MSHNKDFVQLYTKKERQAHIDLSTPCTHYISTKGVNKGSHATNRTQRIKARENTLEHMKQLHGVQDWQLEPYEVCHLCPNNSASSLPCTNPLHCYVGTRTENINDIPPKRRKNGGKTSFRGPDHNTKKRIKCEWCGHETTVIHMANHKRKCLARPRTVILDTSNISPITTLYTSGSTTQ